MNTVLGAFEAKTKLPELLRRVERGERFTITHRGAPIADLVPAGIAAGSATEAVRRMREFPRRRVADAEVAALIAEGRR